MMKAHSILSIALLLTCALLETWADKGDTIAQAKAKYGSPVAEMQSKGQTIHVYQTPDSKITETYDKNGICVISEAELLLTEQPTPIVLEEPIVEIQPEISAPEEQPTEEVQQKQRKKKSPVLLTILFLGLCVAGITLYMRQRKSPSLSL